MQELRPREEVVCADADGQNGLRAGKRYTIRGVTRGADKVVVECDDGHERILDATRFRTVDDHTAPVFADEDDGGDDRFAGDEKTSPKHYELLDGLAQTVELIEDRLPDHSYRGYLEGNVIKYMMRHRRKDGVDDLKKALKYLEWLIDTYAAE